MATATSPSTVNFVMRAAWSVMLGVGMQCFFSICLPSPPAGMAIAETMSVGEKLTRAGDFIAFVISYQISIERSLSIARC